MSELKSPCLLQPSQGLAPRAEEPAWADRAEAGRGTLGLFPKNTDTAQAAMEQAQAQALSRASSSSITTAHVPKMGSFTHTGVTTPARSLTQELGGGVRLMCFPV